MNKNFKKIALIFILVIGLGSLVGCSSSMRYKVDDVTLVKRETTGKFLSKQNYFHFKKDNTELVFTVTDGQYRTYREGTHFNITYIAYKQQPSLEKMEVVDTLKKQKED